MYRKFAVKDGKEAMKRLKAEKDRRAKERQLEKLKEIEKDVRLSSRTNVPLLVCCAKPMLIHQINLYTGTHEIHDARF